MQHFRDAHQVLWDISSYALKTVVMNMVEDDPILQFWGKSEIDQYILKVSTVLKIKIISLV